MPTAIGMLTSNIAAVAVIPQDTTRGCIHNATLVFAAVICYHVVAVSCVKRSQSAHAVSLGMPTAACSCHVLKHLRQAGSMNGALHLWTER